MSKKLKIIIAIILALILALGIYIAPRIIPYTPPNPNIIKTDQGSFELRLLNKRDFTLFTYSEYENYAKDYYSNLPLSIKNTTIEISSEGRGGELLRFSLHFFVKSNFKQLFYSNYFLSTENYKYEFKGFSVNSNIYNEPLITLEQLLQTPEYQQYKLN
jgi:hypothetical protein